MDHSNSGCENWRSSLPKDGKETTMRTAQWVGSFNEGSQANTVFLPAGQLGATPKAGHQQPCCQV